MADFEHAIKYVVTQEGGLIDNKNDPGGITNYGISLSLLKSMQHDVEHDSIEITPIDIRNLTIEQASEIYQQKFWNDAYNDISNQRLATYIFDMAVNLSPLIAHKIFQRASWAYTQHINFLVDDGNFGALSLKMANAYSVLLLPSIRAERAGYYRMLAKIKPKLDTFLTGWLNRTYNL